MKAGELVRIYDPDEDRLDGYSYSALGVLVSIEHKTPIWADPESYRIFKIYLDGDIRHFDEPYWTAEVINSD